MSSTNRALVPPSVASVRPYVADRGIEEVARTYHLRPFIKLASNANRLGPSPIAAVRMRDSLDHLYLYPTGLDLRSKLAKRFGTQVKNGITGSGSEGIKANIVRTFLCDDDETLTSESA